MTKPETFAQAAAMLESIAAHTPYSPQETRTFARELEAGTAESDTAKRCVAFLEDVNALDEFSNLAKDLFDVADAAGQYPTGWKSVSSDESYNAVIDGLGGIYAAARIGGVYHDDEDDVDFVFRALIEEFLDDEVISLAKGQENDLKAILADASNLQDFADALNKMDAFSDSRNGDRSRLYDATDFRTFGGDEIEDANGIYSWDETSILEHSGITYDPDIPRHSGWIVSPRPVEDAA